jgi:hypothetical protein
MALLVCYQGKFVQPNEYIIQYFQPYHHFAHTYCQVIEFIAGVIKFNTITITKMQRMGVKE